MASERSAPEPAIREPGRCCAECRCRRDDEGKREDHPSIRRQGVKSIASFFQCGGSRKKRTSFLLFIHLLPDIPETGKIPAGSRCRFQGVHLLRIFTNSRLYEDFYRSIQEDPGIFLTRGDVIEVTRDGDWKTCDHIR